MTSGVVFVLRVKTPLCHFCISEKEEEKSWSLFVDCGLSIVKKNRSFPPGGRDVCKPSTDQNVVVLVKKEIVHSVGCW